MDRRNKMANMTRSSIDVRFFATFFDYITPVGEWSKAPAGPSKARKS